MNINGREVGFAYTVGAHCDYTDYCVNHGKNISKDRADVRKILCMNKAYNEMHGVTEGALTEKEMLRMNFSTFLKLKKEAEAIEARDSGTTIETEPPKNAEGAEVKASN